MTFPTVGAEAALRERKKRLRSPHIGCAGAVDDHPADLILRPPLSVSHLTTCRRTLGRTKYHRDPR
jgi:hypothetical protein